MEIDDRDLDNLIKLAASRARQEGVADELRREIESIGLCALARDIDAYLESEPQTPYAKLLRALSNLNQGEFDDLHRMDFVSYIISTLDVDNTELTAARQALRSFLLSRGEKRSKLAARDAKSDVEASGAEFRSLLSRRVS
jgi:hypothetical protein